MWPHGYTAPKSGWPIKNHKNMNMDNRLDILKNRWQGLNSARDFDMPPEMTRPGKRAARSHRSKLTSMYTRLAAVGVIFTVLSPILFTEAGLPMWLSEVSAVYFMIMSVMCLSVLRKLRQLDFGNMPTLTLLSRVKEIITLRRLHLTIGLITAIPLIGFMLYQFMQVDIAMFYGGVCGLVIGVIIGINNDIQARKHIKAIREELMTAFS